MSKFSTSWNLLKDSWRVLMRDKEIMLFPMASGIACLLVLLTFAVPWLGATALSWRGVLRGQSDSVMFVLLFLYYLCNFFVVVFFNAALVDFVVTRLRGGEPTIRGSLRAAVACLPQIAVWSLISATVGVVLQWLSQRAGFITRIAISLVGVAWALLTYFVIPFIVIDRRGALDAIGDSKELLRKTWGQQVISGVGFGLVGFLLVLPGIAVLIASIFGVLMANGAGWEFWGLLAVAAVLYFVALGVVLSTLKAIFGAALYLFATSGETPNGFLADDLRGAIKPA